MVKKALRRDAFLNKMVKENLRQQSCHCYFLVIESNLLNCSKSTLFPIWNICIWYLEFGFYVNWWHSYDGLDIEVQWFAISIGLHLSL